MSQGFALIQKGLISLNYGPLTADGIPGPKSLQAMSDCLANGGKEKTVVSSAPSSKYPNRAGMVDFYGAAGNPDCTAGSVVLPFSFAIAWDQSQQITRFSCHKLLAAPLTSIFAEAAKHYGEIDYRALRLDQFGGCYNYRNVRNGTSLSIHSWGAAVDLDPSRNQLSWGRDKATFAKRDYEPFWKIVEATGAASLGRAKNYDWMHFQFCDL